MVAPSSIAACTTWQRKSGSERLASSAENSTSSVYRRARRTASRARSTTSSRLNRSFSRMWRSLVEMNTWMRDRSAPCSASPARSMSRSVQRASAAITGFRTSAAISRTLR